MPDAAFDTLMRHFMLVVVAFVAVNLAIGKFRARALIEAGRTTAEEVSKFVRAALALVGGAFVAFWLIQSQSSSHDVYCLMEFPPSSVEATSTWTVQALLTGTIVWWLWAREGHEILARLAPAFTAGDVLKRQYRPKRVRLAVSAAVIGAPLMNIAMQQLQPGLHAAC